MIAMYENQLYALFGAGVQACPLVARKRGCPNEHARGGAKDVSEQARQDLTWAADACRHGHERAGHVLQPT